MMWACFAGFAALLLVIQPAGAQQTCYGALVSSFSWCSGYEKAGYFCAGSGNDEYCASSQCLGTCFFCAVEYPGNVVDSITGRCCDSIDSSGNCINPKPAAAPPNYDYGWPDQHPGLIFEGCVPYADGPICWQNGTQESESGAYAFITNAPSGSSDVECPPIPAQVPVDPSKVHPISLRAHGVAIDGCVIACNKSEIFLTGVDPCNAGSVSSPVAANMSCYSGGTHYLHPDFGICAYNCTARLPDGSYCSAENFQDGQCELYCDPRLIGTGLNTLRDHEGIPSKVMPSQYQLADYDRLSSILQVGGKRP